MVDGERPRSLADQLALSAKRGYSWLIAASAVPLAVFLWIYPPKTAVSLAVVVPPALLGVAVILTLGHAVTELWRDRQHPLPRVLFAREAPQYGVRLSLLLEPSPLFNYGHGVSIYRHDSQGFEVFIGVGKVLNVQEDSRILVGIVSIAAGQHGTLDSLTKNTKDVLDQTRVKPFVPDLQLWNTLLGSGADGE